VIDLLVVGAGPVGLVAAIHAAEAGLEVTVIEPRAGTIDKACGEGLMPRALQHLARIGVNPAGMNFFGIRYTDGKSSSEARFSSEPGRGVRRTVLHDALRERASELNIKFLDGRVEEIVQNGSSIQAAGVQARYLIGADGLHSTVRGRLGLEVVARKKGRQRYGIRQHFEVAPWSDLVEVYWLPNAEVYVTPIDDSTVGVAMLGSAGLDFNEVIASVPQLAERLNAIQPASKLRGAGPLRQRVSRRSDGRALLVGDAAGYVDALTGEGLQVGFAEAQAAVIAVQKDQPAAYEAEWKKITRSYRLRSGGLLWASSNRFIRPMIVPAAQRLPSVFRQLVNSLS